MSNRSNLPPNQDQKKFVQDEEVGKSTDRSKAKKNNEPNKGYDEDQPGHPVRTTGSNRPDQESYLSNGAKNPGEDNTSSEA